MPQKYQRFHTFFSGLVGLVSTFADVGPILDDRLGGKSWAAKIAEICKKLGKDGR